MRSSRLSALVLPFTLTAMAAISGCSGDSETTAPLAEPDAAIDSPTDTAKPDSSVDSSIDSEIDSATVDSSVDSTVVDSGQKDTTVDVPTDTVADSSDGGCNSDSDCDDKIPCTVDSCSAGACSHWAGPITGTTACSSGKVCDPKLGCVTGTACATTDQCKQQLGSDACKANITCNASSSVCQYTILDKDADGHPPVICGGDDCNDSDNQIYPGAPERCDSVDDDCDGNPNETGICADVLTECKASTCSCKADNVCPGSIACVDKLKDTKNCGLCGNVCPAGAAASCNLGKCSCSPLVTSVVPSKATRNRTTVFAVDGLCLGASLEMDLQDCPNPKVKNKTDTHVEFECVPTGPLGKKNGKILSGGKEVLAFVVETVYEGDRQSCDDGPMCGLPSDLKSCCDSIPLPGGQYLRGRGVNGADACPSLMSCGSNETPEHTAQISAFSLDRYEVTVGRFRKFMETYDGTPPPEGAGANAHIPNSGWKSEWNAQLKPKAELQTELTSCQYGDLVTATPGAKENHAVYCVGWYEAFAFCVWDGGRLPTEAEWEYVAAGAEKNWRYPWGTTAPDATRARVDCANSNGCTVNELVAVGLYPAGASRWGHMNLSDNVSEATLDRLADVDTYSAYASTPCVDCAFLSNFSWARRVYRGGMSSSAPGSAHRSAYRNVGLFDRSGLRCARSIP